MARTHHPNRYNYDSHPYWLYQWWANHAPSSMRRQFNRSERAKAKQAVRRGEDPPGRKSMRWYFW